MRSPALGPAALLLLLAPFWTWGQEDGERNARDGLARVTYVTGSTAYIDAGRDDGLAPGDTVEVVRESGATLTLTVTEVSNHRATCSLPDGAPAVAVGDRVRFRVRRIEAAPTASVRKPRENRRRNAARSAGFRGRVGLRYLTVRNRTAGRTEYSQPGIDLRIDGDRIGGGPWSVDADVRTSRITRTGRATAETTDDRTRVYRMAVGYGGTASPWRLTVGRQFTPSLASVSIFDGVSFVYRKRRWGTGLFTGTQPDPLDFSYDSQIREHGAWIQVGNSSPTGRSWLMTTGVVGSYAGSEVNREYIYLQGRYTGRRLFVYGLQEVDYNRDWKRDLENESVSPTSTLVSLRIRAGNALTFTAGYDNRRLVRLYRDRETPETEFDDAFRRGAWVGTQITFAPKFRVGLDARANSGESSAQDSEAQSVTFSAGGFGRARLFFQARGTSFSAATQEGTLVSLASGVSLGRRVNVRVTGGVRDDRSLMGPESSTSLDWLGLDLDVALARHWYYFVSVERTDGDLEAYDQLYTSLTYRF